MKETVNNGKIYGHLPWRFFSVKIFVWQSACGGTMQIPRQLTFIMEFLVSKRPLFAFTPDSSIRASDIEGRNSQSGHSHGTRRIDFITVQAFGKESGQD
jgi:hypothetical protein